MGRYTGFFGIDSDHELEAYESMEWDYDGSCYEPFTVDRNFYHMWITFNFIARETEKSYLIVQHGDFNLWIPKKIVRRIEDNRMLVHKNIYLDIYIINFQAILYNKKKSISRLIIFHFKNIFSIFNFFII